MTLEEQSTAARGAAAAASDDVVRPSRAGAAEASVGTTAAPAAAPPAAPSIDPAPAATGGRTRSIWWYQLVLAAAVVVVTVVLLVVSKATFLENQFAAGVGGVLALTAATLAAPWARLPRAAVFAVPLLDILCIGLMTTAADMRLAVLWAFPVIWIGSYGSVGALSAALGLIAASFVVVSTRLSAPVPLLPLTIVVVTSAFIGVSAHAAARRHRASRRLLRLQAARHRSTSRRLADDERRIVELTDALDDGIARVGAGGRLIFVNAAFARLYGVDPADLTQPPRSIDYHDTGSEPVPEHDRPVQRAGRGETFADVRVWLFDTEGRWRALSISSKRLGHGDGDEDAMFLIARDISEVVAAQREREQLAAIATHEMRHPLTAIIGNAELALDLGAPDAGTRARLETILTSSEHLHGLVSDFLARVGRDRDAQGATAFDLRGVLTGSAQSFAAAAAAGDVTVQLELPDPLPVVADAFRMRQVVDNLVSNAIKYTRQGGRVIVAGRAAEGRIVATITDTGIGMSSADLARVFDPYFRSSAAEEFAPGTGLGMGIAHELLRRQGGTLGVDSRLDAGTTVTIDLPAASGRRSDRRTAPGGAGASER